MVFILVIGDLHIPQRANDLPQQFKKMLVPGKIEKIFCTGNLCTKETYDFLKKITPDIFIARGDFDDPKLVSEISKTVKVEGWKIGIIHGHQIVPWNEKEALSIFQRKLDVDVLVFGHTHKYLLFHQDGKYYVNPGSATGSYSSITDDVVPSFVLMDVQEDTITNYVYFLVDKTVQVKKKIFKKKIEEKNEKEKNDE